VGERESSELGSSNQPISSCSSGAALTGVPVHVSTNQICISKVSALIIRSGGPSGLRTLIPNSSRSSRTSAMLGLSPASTWPPGRSQTSGYQRRSSDL